MEDYGSRQVDVKKFGEIMSGLRQVADGKAHIEVLGMLPVATTSFRKREYFGVTPPSKKLPHVVTNLTSFLDVNRALITEDHKNTIARIYGQFHLGTGQELTKLFGQKRVGMKEVAEYVEPKGELVELQIDGKKVTRENYDEILGAFKDKEARSDFKDAVRNELLQRPAKERDLETLKFIEKACKLDRYTEGYFPYLHDAIIHKQDEIFEYLMTKGVEKLDGRFFVKNQGHATPVERALIENKLEVAKRLVDAGFSRDIDSHLIDQLKEQDWTDAQVQLAYKFNAEALMPKISEALDKGTDLEFHLKALSRLSQDALKVFGEVEGAEIVLARLHGHLSLDKKLFEGLHEGVKALFKVDL